MWLIMSKQESKWLTVFMSILLLAAMFAVGRETAQYAAGRNVQVQEKCVVIDAGHGGMDPGKIGINGLLEKDVNLEIALLVKSYLEQNDIRVVMTRETDAGLYDENASDKKVQDMKRRLEVLETTKPVLAVSIHQNSYPQELVHGAQVFYYENSQEGQELAQSIQTQLWTREQGDKKRQIKANDTYYLLKKTSVPIVIAECGFLSNSTEAELLGQKEYQEKIAWAIAMGIIQYLAFAF